MPGTTSTSLLRPVQRSDRVHALLLNPVTYEPAGWLRHLTASLPAFAVAAVAHWVGTRLVLTRRADWGGYR